MFNSDINSYLNNLYERLATEISSFSDEKILTANFDEWVEYFYSTYEVGTVIWYTDSTTQTVERSTITEPILTMGYFGEVLHNSKEVQAFAVWFDVPFDGNVDLFNLEVVNSVKVYPPPTYNARIDKPKGDRLGSLIFRLKYAEKEALDDEVKFQAKVAKDFKNELALYQNKLAALQPKINEFNGYLKANILKLLTARKEKADELNRVAKALNISLPRNPNAPNVTPIPLKRVMKKPTKEPTGKPVMPEYSIADDDFKNIINIINTCVAAMEMTPISFENLGEEALRDVILATLSTHYQVTGETLHKGGKTDILIQFENKAAYVGECKIWHGAKLFDEAITQLKSYTTWRDTKVSIIIFNKENANFTALLKTIDEWVKINTTNLLPLQPKNIWNSTLIDKDTSQQYQLHIAVYDLYVKPNSR